VNGVKKILINSSKTSTPATDKPHEAPKLEEPKKEAVKVESPQLQKSTSNHLDTTKLFRFDSDLLMDEPAVVIV
jgi:hypothetical protein